MTVGTSTRADLSSRTERLMESLRRNCSSRSSNSSVTTSVSFLRIVRTHQKLRSNLQEENATPRSHVMASQGASRPKKIAVVWTAVSNQFSSDADTGKNWDSAAGDELLAITAEKSMSFSRRDPWVRNNVSNGVPIVKVRHTHPARYRACADCFRNTRRNRAKPTPITAPCQSE